MKYFLSFMLFCPALCLTGTADAEIWKVSMSAVKGRASYSHTQESHLGRQAKYTGKALVRGEGPARDIIFNTFLNAPEDGHFRLDYQVEIAGPHRARPPFQAGGKVLLRPGKPVLAANAGGWKFILELQGTAGGKYPEKGTGKLETSLKCGKASYPAGFMYLPDEQYSAVLYSGSDSNVRKYMVGLLPKSSGVDGTFLLQYALLLKEGAETLVDNQGQLIMAPGDGKHTAAAGKDCVFSAKALR